jgi:hypothetical protein
MLIPSKHIEDFFVALNSSGINYVLIKNINNELPNNLENGKDIDILVHANSKILFEALMSESFIAITQPLGTANGWSFAYGLIPYQFWKRKNIKEDLYVDASFALSCKSLTPKIWIPLDKKIQQSVWDNKFFDKELNFWRIDYKNLFVYLLVRCIFDKKIFSDLYIKEIENHKNFLSDNYVLDVLHLIFFNFTSTLVKLLKTGMYEKIINEYISFKEY